MGGAGFGGEAGEAGQSGAPGVGGAVGVGGALAVGGTSGVGGDGSSGIGGSSGTPGTGGISGTGGSAGTDGVGGVGGGGSAGTSGAGAGGATAGTSGTAGDGAGGLSGAGSGGVAGAGAGGVSTGGVGGSGGAECNDTPVTLASSAQAWGLAVRGGYAYFTTHETHGSVQRVATSGGVPTTISADEMYPHDVAVNDELVFFATAGSVPGHLYKAALDGSGRTEIARGASGDFQGIFNLSADANNVYYTSFMNVLAELSPSGAWGSEVKISGGPFNSMIVDAVLFDNDLYWTNHGVGTFVNWSAQTAAVMRGDVTLVNAPYALVNRLDYPQFAIAVDEDGVFWSDESAIYRTSRDGGQYSTFVTLLPAPADVSPLVDMVSDGVDLFFADRHALYRVPVSGGEPELMTGDWSRITRLAQDADSIYFTDPNLGKVVKIAKCASAPGGGGYGQGGAAGAGGAGAGGAGAGGAGAGGAAGVGSGDVATATPVVAVTNPHGLATDDTYLYYSLFGSSGGGGVQRIPLAGGSPETLVSGETKVHDIAVDSDSVYFCLADTSAGHLAKVPKAGGTRVALATGTNSYGVGRVASDGVFVYYVTGFNIVYRLLAAGGTPGMVAVGPFNSTASDLAIDRGRVFWVNDGTFNSNFSARLPGTAYVGETAASGSRDFGRDDVLGGIDAPARIAVDGGKLYFIVGTTLYTRDETGGAVTSLGTTAPASGTIVDLMSDAQFVYFATAHGVYRIPAAGGATQTMVSGYTDLRSLAADATQIYFTDYAGNAVMKFPK